MLTDSASNVKPKLAIKEPNIPNNQNAFWLFGIFGSFIASFGLTLLAESVSKIFYIPFVAVNVGIIACLWECAENYKKEKLQKKQSAVWGYLTQVFCGVGALGLISTIIDIFKTL